MAPGQFLLEQSRLAEAAEMAERAAELESSEFDVVFNAAHMLRSVGRRAPLRRQTVARSHINHGLTVVKAQMLRGESKQRRRPHFIAVFSPPQRLAGAHTDGVKKGGGGIIF